MTDVLDAYIEGLERARYSDATLKARRRLIETMPAPLEMDREDIQTWWITRQLLPNGDPRAASSLSQERSHVRAFYQWCLEQGHIEGTNRADFIPKTRQEMRKADPVKEPELLILMEKAQGPMKLMIALASMAGLRAAEIAVVTWEDIDRNAGVIWARQGKGKKDRSVPLSAGFLGALGDPGKGLIIGKPMTPKAVSAAMERFLRSSGVDATAHKLRARFATRFLAATGDLVATAEAMGHASVSTTAMYAIASSDTMRRGAEAAGRIG